MGSDGNIQTRRRVPWGRPEVRSALRSLTVSVVIVIGYFTLPFTSPFTANTTIFLVGGLVSVAGLLAWQVMTIRVSRFPRARAFATLATTVPLFFVVFASAYHLMSRADAGNWSEPMSRLDALYFTVTTFATVGFGDISAESAAARAVVTVQIILDLVLIGLMTRVIVRAVQEALGRQQEGSEQPRRARA
jgi:hypothetical protein